MKESKNNPRDYTFRLDNPSCKVISLSKNGNERGNCSLRVSVIRYIRKNLVKNGPLKKRDYHRYRFNQKTNVIKFRGFLRQIKTFPIHLVVAGNYNGLARIDNNGKIAKKKLLNSFLEIKTNRQLIDFIKENGPLFRMQDKNSDIIDCDAVFAVIDRLRITQELHNIVRYDFNNLEDAVDHAKLKRGLFLTLYLLIIPPKFKMDCYTYKKTVTGRLYKDHLHFANKLYTVFDEISPYITKPINDFAYLIRDTMGNFKGAKLNVVSKEKYDESIRARYNYLEYKLNQKELDGKINNINYECYHKIAYLYLFGFDFDKSTRMIIDTLYHLFHDYCEGFDLTEIENLPLGNSGISNTKFSSFSKEMKTRIKILARLAIENELNSNLKDIRPKYDSEKLLYYWDLYSLESALNFCLFYPKSSSLDSAPLIYDKTCEYCGKTFFSNRIDRLYCSDTCSSCKRQRALRQSRKENTDKFPKSP